MSLEWSINSLEQTGDPVDQTRAAILRAILEERGEDVPMPADTQSKQLSLEPSQDASKQIGMLILPSGAAQIETDVSSLEEHVDAQEQLKESLDTFLTPYTELFQRYMPDAEENDRNWRGKMKEGVIGQECWNEQKLINQLMYTYGFALTYKRGTTQNRLKDVQMYIGGPESNQLGVAEIYVDADSITGFKFTWNESLLGTIYEVTEKGMPGGWHDTWRRREGGQAHPLVSQTALGEFIRKNTNAAPIHFTDEVSLPYVRVTIHPELSIELIEGTRERWSVFTYDGVTQVFQREYHAGQQQKGEDQYVDEQAFEQLVRSIFGLIPAAEL